MAWKKSPDLPNPIPPRPQMVSQQSNSLPTSPYQRPRDLPARTRSPSLGRDALNTSPRSIQSESGQPLVSNRGLRGGCKYENAYSYIKRRIPYSEGDEILQRPDKIPKEYLTEEEEKKLTHDIMELYERLLPTPESDERRVRLAQKLEDILKAKWPNNKIEIRVFGSSGNKLGTTDSDVDISVMTDCKDIETVCNLADLFAKKGMERVVCISNAKVPLVKIWDPELKLACDMNVNQDIALENTDLIRTYVELDERVRPLAMIIKYWTRRRILNDAGRNFTISSYTWICMIVNFLQTRKVPILPSLQRQADLEKREIKKVDVSFARDVEALKKMGARNTESVGQLFFRFFRYYGFEVDYEKTVISVRQGKVVDKSDRWQRQQNNRLCVEEPFNTSWNLGKTADDTSFRGVHKELRRAFDFASQADLDSCCEQYVFPKEEPRSAAIPIQRPAQTVTVQPSRNSRGNRGGRNGNTFPRGTQPQGRRASSASTRGPAYGRQPQWPVMAQDLSLQAEQQYLLHDHLYRQYQLLQAQEQELRMQLHQQAIQNGGAYPALLWPHFRVNQEEVPRQRAGSVNPAVMSAPIRQGHFNLAPQFAPSNLGFGQGTNTSPPSPLSSLATPDARRNSRRSSMHSGSAASTLRAHSQPAQRPLRSPIPQQVMHLESALKSPTLDSGSRRGRGPPEAAYAIDIPPTYYPTSPTPSGPNDSRRNSAYLNYYASPSPEPPPVPTNASVEQGDEEIYSATNGSIPVANTYNIGQRLHTERNGSEINSAQKLPATTTASAASYSSMAPLVIDGSKPLARHRARKEESSPWPQLDRHDTNGSSAISSAPSPDDVAANLPAISHLTNGSRSEKSRFASPPGNGLGIIHGHPSPEPLAASIQTKPSEMENSQLYDLQTSDSRSDNEASPTRERKPNQSHPRSDVEPVSRAQVLSPVKEVRTPSPTSSRGYSSVDRFNISNKSRSSNNDKPVHVDRLENIPTIRMTPTTNGTVISEPIKHVSNGQHQTNGWQTATTKRKHKKAARSVNELAGTNAVRGEFLPADEKMRKGG